MLRRCEVKRRWSELEWNDDDLEASRKTIRPIYADQDAFLLLLTKSQGSRFENCLDEIVDISEQQYRRLCDMVTSATGRPRIDDYMTLDDGAHYVRYFFMHLFLHESEGKYGTEACGCPLARYLARGWMGMMTELIYAPRKVRTLQGCCFRILT